MKSVRLRTAVIEIATAVTAVVGCTQSGHAKVAGPAPAPSTTSVQAIVINAEAQEVLTPTPRARAQLSSQQAWVIYSRSVGHAQKAIPSETKAVLGRLTLPPQYTDRLVWAFSYGPVGCLTTLSQSTPSRGFDWTFVDANTGEMLEATCQHTQ